MAFIPDPTNITQINEFRDATANEQKGRAGWQTLLDDGTPDAIQADAALNQFLSPALQVYLRIGATSEFTTLKAFVDANVGNAGASAAAVTAMNNGIASVQQILNPAPPPDPTDPLAAGKTHISQAVDAAAQLQVTITDLQEKLAAALTLLAKVP